MRLDQSSGRGGAAARMVDSAKNRHNPKYGPMVGRVEVELMLRAAEDRCAKTGLELDYTYKPGNFTHIHGPSLDRINNARRDYTRENVQIVTLGYNVARNRFATNDLIRQAHAMAWGPVWTAWIQGGTL